MAFGKPAYYTVMSCGQNSLYIHICEIAMVDILSVVFQRFGSQLHASGDIKLSSQPESSTLVVGDENINRSLLFLTALTAASEMGYKVLFFTQNQIQSLPVTVQDSFLKPENLKVTKKVKLGFLWCDAFWEIVLKLCR